MGTDQGNTGSLSGELRQLAGLYGVMLRYDDVYGQTHHASEATVLATLRALGVAITDRGQIGDALQQRQRQLLRRGLEPVVVAWDGQPGVIQLTLPAPAKPRHVDCLIQLETGVIKQRYQLDDLQPAAEVLAGAERYWRWRLPLPGNLPWGYHRLVLEAAQHSFEAMIIAAPQTACWPLQDDQGDLQANGARPHPARGWGCFLPLYAVRTARDWGAGDFSDMQQLVSWTAGLGGNVVASLPLLATYLDEPCDPSPYAPVSRLFWNAFYIDPRQVPELAHSPRAGQKLNSEQFASEIARLRAAEWVDYRRLAALKRDVLELVMEDFCRDRTGRYEQFARFVADDPTLEDYARFRAAHERRPTPWQQWPARLREGQLEPDDYDPQTQRYHCFAQWLAAEQLQAVARHGDQLGCGLYLDLPLGVREDSYDVWRYRNIFATGATAGAPPDAVWTGGQNWGFSPFHPEAVRHDGYRHVRDFLSRQFRVARYLRIDHVMGLHRLFWIPDGMTAREGTYVRYHPDEWYAVLCLESHRHQTGIVGENLGTVPHEVNRSMQEHQVRHLYVAQYELESEAQPQPPRDARCVASLNTHDTPMFAAWWQAEDLDLRLELQLLDARGRRTELQRRDALKRELAGWLREQHSLDPDQDPDRFAVSEVVAAALRMLADSPAELVIVNLEDLWGEARPQNIPGTAFERPNWRRKAAVRLDALENQEGLRKVLRAVDRGRRAETGRRAPEPNERSGP
jgi:4-alpha-glucanotransferase